MQVSLCASGRMRFTQVFDLCLINLPMEGKKVIKTIKRLAACLLITVFIFGSLTLTSAEAAMKKPGNNRFVQWNNVQFTSCTIAWNKVSGASAYQIRCTWTDGSHADSRSNGYVDAKYNAVKLNGLHYQHVYYATVRAVKISNGRITSYSPWSNIVFITPWPKNVSGRKGSGLTAKLNWNIIYGSNGYNVFLTTNPSGKWYWNLSTSTYATSTSATVKKYRGSSLKSYTNYYLRVITRRKRNGVFCTVPEPYSTYYQYGFRFTYR